MRSTLAAGFSTKQLNEMIAPVDEQITKFALSLKKLKGEPIDGKVMASKFAIDAFTTASFSMVVTDSEEDIRSFDKSPFVAAVLQLLNPSWKILIPFVIPYGGNIMDALGVTSFDTRCLNFFEKFCRDVLNQRKQNKGGRGKDFLNLMLNSEITEKEAIDATKGLTMNEIIGQLFVFFVAGYETTASTVTNSLLYLVRHPKYMEKIREEADNATITDCTSLNEASLPWTCAVINEVMRLSPSVGQHIRVADLATDELIIDKIKFKNGYNIEVPVDLLHTHPDYWDEPHQFKPERFVKNPELAKQWFFAPFGGGPRNCIGMRLALFEVRLGVLRIMQNFDVSFPKGFVDDIKCIRTMTTFLTYSKNPNFVFTERQ